MDYPAPGLDLLLHWPGWSVQVPARRAAEQNEEQISAWREEGWPETKRSRRTCAPGWSSKTSPATGLQAAERPHLGRRGRTPVVRVIAANGPRCR
ncbi:MAG TPA: winged helix-turn-helix domain-containing protein [Blastococcus sp.]